MIQKLTTPSGGTVRFVVPSPYPWPRSQKFDPWLSHEGYGSFYLGFGSNPGIPIESVVFSQFVLTSGESFTYTHGPWASADGAEPLFLAARDFVPLGYAGTAQGEGFNALLRPATTLKVPTADWDTVRAGHGYGF